jgi:hypothetical protein
MGNVDAAERIPDSSADRLASSLGPVAEQTPSPCQPSGGRQLGN